MVCTPLINVRLNDIIYPVVAHMKYAIKVIYFITINTVTILLFAIFITSKNKLIFYVFILWP